MSGMSPQKDQLVHNNLAHKVLFHLRGRVSLSDFGDVVSTEVVGTVVRVEKEGFSVTREGSVFILKNLPREVMSHREVKIMKDMNIHSRRRAQSPPRASADMSRLIRRSIRCMRCPANG